MNACCIKRGNPSAVQGNERAIMIIIDDFGLTDIFIARRGDDQGASAWLLRYSVVVDLPVVRFAVLFPSIPKKC